MHPITYEKMSECIHFRRSVANCSRCGGTGKYSSTTGNSLSAYGDRCFQCGSAYKLPKSWTTMSPKQIVDLIPASECKVTPIKFLQQLRDVRILTEQRYQKVITVLESSARFNTK